MATDTQSNVLERLLKIIKDETGFDTSTISLQTELKDVVKDSLEYASLIIALEGEFADFPNQPHLNQLLLKATNVAGILHALEQAKC